MDGVSASHVRIFQSRQEDKVLFAATLVRKGIV